MKRAFLLAAVLAVPVSAQVEAVGSGSQFNPGPEPGVSLVALYMRDGGGRFIPAFLAEATPVRTENRNRLTFETRFSPSLVFRLKEFGRLTLYTLGSGGPLHNAEEGFGLSAGAGALATVRLRADLDLFVMLRVSNATASRVQVQPALGVLWRPN